jgi:predicted metal-dependent HD superfamily phosphohydrolase
MLNQLVIEGKPTLLALYNGKDRFYHSINHINFCLGRFEEAKKFYKLDPVIEDAIEIAIWYHDAIYNAEAQMVSPGYSEHASSELMYAIAEKMIMDDKIALKESILIAERCIKATAEHGKKHELFAEQLMCDIDLAGLGLPWTQFEKNTDDVIAEYALFRDPRIIIEGNAKFLKKLIDSGEPIFQTEWGKQYEEMAQWNIKHRIALVLPPSEQF